MHTFTDCGVGLALGAMSVFIQTLPLVREFELRGGAEAPLVLFAGFLALLELIPMPADECPCHDDAVESGAVALGAFIGRWVLGGRHLGAHMDIMPGSGWAVDSATGEWVQVPVNWTVWAGVASVKMVMGQC